METLILVSLVGIPGIFLAIRLFATLVNAATHPILSRRAPLPAGSFGKVSVLIPARNEVKALPLLLPQLDALGDQIHEVLILDDESTDGTTEFLQDYCLTHPRFRHMRGSPLEAGWLGKNRACHQLASEATGDYFLFLDADIYAVGKELIPRSMAVMKAKAPALLSLFPDQKMDTFGEKITVPLMHYMLLSLLPLSWIYRLPFPSMAAANGQFMLFDARLYREYRWHERVKNIMVEDIAIMQEVKKAGLKGVTLLAGGHITCKMYASFPEAVNGFSRSILGGFGNSVPGLAIYLLLVVIIWPLSLAFVSPPVWLIWAAAIIGQRWLISRLAGQSAALNLIFHPVQMVSLVWIGITAIKKRLSRTQEWKGRNVH